VTYNSERVTVAIKNLETETDRSNEKKKQQQHKQITKPKQTKTQMAQHDCLLH